MDITIIMTARDEKYVIKTIDDIIDNTDYSGLKEIIVIDDCSKEPIKHDQARVIRNSEPLGLIYNRHMAATLADTEAIISIDPHCKVYSGWVLPLLLKLVENYKNISIPMTQVLNPEKWVVDRGKKIGLKTGWNWNLDFSWYDSEGAYTPAIAGHCFAFTKDWFEESDGFDTAMGVWGGENIEFSLKTWLCGGSVEVVSSRVAHWFKDAFQYPMDGMQLFFNKMRVVETWFDDYAGVFYESQGIRRGTVGFGDIDRKLRVKKTLQEKSFQWFLENLQPNLLEQVEPQWETVPHFKQTS